MRNRIITSTMKIVSRMETLDLFVKGTSGKFLAGSAIGGAAVGAVSGGISGMIDAHRYQPTKDETEFSKLAELVGPVLFGSIVGSVGGAMAAPLIAAPLVFPRFCLFGYPMAGSIAFANARLNKQKDSSENTSSHKKMN